MSAHDTECRCGPPDPDLVRRPPVEWYDPRELLRVVGQLAIATALGTRVDSRRLDGLFAGIDPTADAFDYSDRPDEDFWFDYLADTGDGFRATYQMAHLLARPALRPGDEALPRGRVLVLGGDQVYPLATDALYRERLLGPFAEAAAQATGARAGDDPRPAPDVFTLPGNHDWYDGLVAFRRIFTRDPTLVDRRLGDGRLPQRRSFFALRLPHGWWLWALDVQLEADIDDVQLRFFADRAAALEAGDRIILCTAEPELGRTDPRCARNIGRLEALVAPRGARVAVYLAGDLHHYLHHRSEAEPPVHRIVSGGGGAFLHPTHVGPDAAESVEARDGRYTRAASFPTIDDSRRLARRLIGFPYRNPSFLGLMALIYLLLTWGLPPGWGEPGGIGQTLLTDLTGVLGAIPVSAWLTGLVLVLGTRAFAAGQTTTRAGFGAFGVLHGVAHIASAVGLHYGLLALSRSLWGGEMGGWLPTTLRVLAFVLLGALWGAHLFGAYLFVGLQGFGAHRNDAFSALRIEGFKNLLRMRITPDGTLEIHPIGLRAVHDHPCDAAPTLIEPPIRIPPDPPPAPAQRPAGA